MQVNTYIEKQMTRRKIKVQNIDKMTISHTMQQSILMSLGSSSLH